MTEANTAKARYEEHVWRRDRFLRKARSYAELTIPQAMPPEGFAHNTGDLPEPYNSIGARAVTHLTNLLSTTSLPPGLPAFRLSNPADVKREAEAAGALQELETVQAEMEVEAMAESDRRNWRAQTNVLSEQLIIAGNGLEAMLPDNSLKVYRLDQFVTLRNGDGKMIECVIKEDILPEALGQETQEVVSMPTSGQSGMVEMYTHYRWESERMIRARQEINGTQLNGIDTVYINQPDPVWAPRWTLIPGEDYGRGKVEETIGTLRSIEALTRSLVEQAAMASWHILMIQPNSGGGGALNIARKLRKAMNGDIIAGDADAVQPLSYDNLKNLEATDQALQRFEQEFAQAYLLGMSAVRDAERVTAYEIRKLIEQLEGTLGGVYSMLANEMQKPRFERLMYQLGQQERLPELPQGFAEPVITTGLDGIGRERETQRVMVFSEQLRMLPEDVTRAYVKHEDLLNILARAQQLTGVIRTEEEAQQKAEQDAAIMAAARGTQQQQQQEVT